MGQADTQYLSSKEAHVVYHKGGQASLFDNVFPSVYGGGAGDFAPDDEDEGDIVDPSVNTIEQIVTKLSAIWQTPMAEKQSVEAYRHRWTRMLEQFRWK